MASEREDNLGPLYEHTPRSQLETACDYARRRRWPVLPLHSIVNGVCTCEKGPSCVSPGKHPIARLVPKGVKNASTDEAIIKSWFEREPTANIGVATGLSSGIFLVEVDMHDGVDGFETLARLTDKYSPLPKTLMANSGGGGLHVLFSYPTGKESAKWKKEIGPGLEIRAMGAQFFVAPPSVHKSGQRYAWIDTLVPLAEAPQWLIELSEKKAPDPSNGNNLSHVCELPTVALPGQRHASIVSFAGTMRARGFSFEAAWEGCLAYNKHQCRPPKKDAEVAAIVEDIYTRYDVGTRSYEENAANAREPCPKAAALFQNNRFINLVRKNVQKFHVGDEPVSELLLLSVASMSVVNTNGLQPKLSGESGMGKTHDVKTLLHLMHPTMYRAASFSSKALFYDDSLQPKTVLFSDDVNLADEVEETVRAAMTNWQTPTEHITLDSKRNSVTLSLPPRIIFWLTSVSSKSTLQLQNRQVEMNVDESLEQDRRVEQHQRKFAELGLEDFYVDDEVKLLREAFVHINHVNFNVRIPFVHSIKFTNVRNRRNFPIFLDFIKAYCVLNYHARAVDEDGALIATKEDFDNALGLFKTVAVQQVTKLNDKERQIAVTIRDNSPCDIDTIMDETGLSNSYVYELIHGSKNSGHKGLLEKIPELKFYSKRDANPETELPWGRNHYSLPEAWDIVSSHESIVYWDDSTENGNQLRTTSECFGAGCRSSEDSTGQVNFSLDGGNGIGCTYTNMNFGTSSTDETRIYDPRFLLERNTETDIDGLSPTVIDTPKSRTEQQNGFNSTSLEAPNLQRRSPDDVLKYVKVKSLKDVPQFVGSDGENYSMRENNRYIVPETDAQILLRRNYAILVR